MGHKLGYIPSFYSGFMYTVLKNNGSYKAKIESIRPEAKPQLKVNISVVGTIPSKEFVLEKYGLHPLETL
ncbi:hypothetical protein [Fodinisporobacter ferrooxydans]|uniref:hypothetical protein n=1 Tax=Fodinisporobacter ferrooxydans TaxID=2901836 RepID=UPI003D317612